MSETAVREMYAAFGRGDIPGILRHLSHDVVWRIHAPAPVPCGGEWRGTAAVAEWFALLARTAEITAYTPAVFIETGPRVIVLGEEKGRSRTTGRDWQTSWVHVWTFRDGRTVSFEDFFDSGRVAQAYM